MTSLFRYKITLSYDGTNFSGWQKQLDARTVQGDFLSAATRVLQSSQLDIQGCGRTDAGVHALEYVAHLEVQNPLDPSSIKARLNAELPKDIAVQSIEKVPPGFHARYHCLARSYIYQIYTQKSAFGKRYGWWIDEVLDIHQMRETAAMCIGSHDFLFLAEKQELKKSTKVRVYDISITCEKQDTLSIRVTASRFLWHMVRRLAAMFVDVGRHRLGAKEIEELLRASAGSSYPHIAPAAGLFFAKALYSEEELQGFLDNPIDSLARIVV